MYKNARDTGLGSRFARREQSGSIMVLAALMMVVLIGFVGLAIDVGHEMGVYRQTQNASDAAALAAAQSLNAQRGFATNAAGFAAATDAATLLVQQNGFPASALNLPLKFYDSSWNLIDPSTGSVKSVRYVQAEVSSSLSTYFIRVLGITLSSVGTKAVSEVKGQGLCSVAGVCVLSSTAHCALDVTGGATVVMTSTVVVDNSGNKKTPGSLCVDNNALISDAGTGAGIYNVGGSNYCTSSCPSGQTPNVNPPPSPSGHISDPLAYLPVPPLNDPNYDPTDPNDLKTPPDDWCGEIHVTSSGSGSRSSCTSGPTNNQTITPGTYCGINVESGGTLTLQPGIYVIFNGSGSCGSGSGLNVAATATIQSNNTSAPNGVMLYFTCGDSHTKTAYDCLTPKDPSKGSLSIAGGATVQLQGIQDTNPADPYSVYNGMLIFYARQNNSAMNLTGNNTTSFTGTIYGAQASVTVAGSAGLTFGADSRLIVSTLKIDGGNGTNPGGGTFNMKSTAANNAQLQVLGGLVR